MQIGDVQSALPLFERIARHHPTSGAAHGYVGLCLHALGDHPGALQAFARAVDVSPTDDLLLRHYATLLIEAKAYTLAAEIAKRAANLDPRAASAWTSLAVAQERSGLLEQARRTYRRAATLDAASLDTLSNIIRLTDLLDSRELGVVERRLYNQHAMSTRPPLSPRQRRQDPARPLQIGYLAGSPMLDGFGLGPLLEVFLAHHDRAAFNVTVYQCDAFVDGAVRLINAECRVVDCAGKSADDVAIQIDNDRIDILVDLLGHARGQATAVLARKPAPIQVTWAATGGSGLSTVDYCFGDSLTVPDEERADFREQVVRVGVPLCFVPPTSGKGVGPLPSLQGPGFTVAHLNPGAPLTEPMVQLLADVVMGVPNTVLLLASDTTMANPDGRAWCTTAFAARGVDAARVRYIESSSQMSDAFAQADIALDTVPLSGQRATLEALWMGLPVVTLSSPGVFGRFGSALSQHVGLGEFVTHDRHTYVATVARWQANRPALAEIRASLRQRLAQSPLCDAAAFAREVEREYRAMFSRWLIPVGAPPPG